jgi:hypothetical protein
MARASKRVRVQFTGRFIQDRPTNKSKCYREPDGSGAVRSSHFWLIRFQVSSYRGASDLASSLKTVSFRAGERIRRQGKPGCAVYDDRRSLPARDGSRSFCASAVMACHANVARREDPDELRYDQRHHRRKLGQSHHRSRRANRGADLRRQPPVLGRELPLRELGRSCRGRRQCRLDPPRSRRFTMQIAS